MSRYRRDTCKIQAGYPKNTCQGRAEGLGLIRVTSLASGLISLSFIQTGTNLRHRYTGTGTTRTRHTRARLAVADNAVIYYFISLCALLLLYTIRHATMQNKNKPQHVTPPRPSKTSPPLSHKHKPPPAPARPSHVSLILIPIIMTAYCSGCGWIGLVCMYSKYSVAPAHARTRAHRPAAPRQSSGVSQTLHPTACPQGHSNLWWIV